jgi:hypothetical protein
MKTFYVQVPDDLGDAMMEDATLMKLPVADFILEGLLAGIGDGWSKGKCQDLLYDYVSKRQ